MPAAGQAPAPERVPIIIVGAGPVGLSLGLGLARLGLRSVILDDDDRLSEGSRAICIQQHTLEIFKRLGAVEPMMARGVTWRLGRVFFRRQEIFQIRLPELDEEFPPFINLQQCDTERFLIEALNEQPLAEIRWLHRVTSLSQNGENVTFRVETPAGERTFLADYVLAADGARSTVRSLLGLSFDGTTYPDSFLIADIRARLDFPKERWFWFDPVFNPGKSALLHPQPDNVWRIDWQLGSEADLSGYQERGKLEQLIRKTIGDRRFEIVWVTTYRFHQRLASRFREGRVFILGDAAHLMSPFGARGMNSGVQDAANLWWKLWLVASGRAPQVLLDTYETERRPAARENLRITGASMAFITPQTRARLFFRNLILRGSVRFKSWRRWVNAGRLSTPFSYDDSPIVSREEHLPALLDRLRSPALNQAVTCFRYGPRAGATAPDARYRAEDGVERRRLLDLIGNHFLVLYFSDDPDRAGRELARAVEASPDLPIKAMVVSADLNGYQSEKNIGWLWDDRGEIARKYGAVPGTLYLIRPDGHVAARGLKFPLAQLSEALRLAAGYQSPQSAESLSVATRLKEIVRSHIFLSRKRRV